MWDCGRVFVSSWVLIVCVYVCVWGGGGGFGRFYLGLVGTVSAVEMSILLHCIESARYTIQMCWPVVSIPQNIISSFSFS